MTVGIQYIVEAATGCSQSPGKRRRVNTANGKWLEFEQSIDVASN